MPETSTPLPQAEIAHQLPGRLRLRVPARRGDHAFFADVATRLAALAGVHGVKTNARTGSLLVEHAGNAETLVRSARASDVLEIVPARPASRRTPDYSGRLAAMPRLSVAAAGLAGLGAVQIARGRVLGSATEHFWTAYRTYSLIGRPRVAALLAAFGLYQLVRGDVLGSAASLFYYATAARRMAQRGSRQPAGGAGGGDGEF